MRVIFKETGKRRLVTYWYDMDGYVTSSNIEAKIITALRGLLKLKTNGAIILIASNLNASDRVEKVAEQQEKFATAIYPFVKEYLISY
jgi:EpsI family protein